MILTERNAIIALYKAQKWEPCTLSGGDPHRFYGPPLFISFSSSVSRKSCHSRNQWQDFRKYKVEQVPEMPFMEHR